MKARGFTLLEALVTLVIVAMVATLLMQSLFQVLGLRERVLRAEREARVSALQERWFRDTVEGAIGDRPVGRGAFVGDERMFRFVTGSPLAADGFAAASWGLVDGPGGASALQYAEGADPWPVVPPRLVDAAFAYRDARGRWHAAWPPEGTTTEALPRAVRLSARVSDRPMVWWVAIPTGPALPPALRSVEEVPVGQP